MRPDAGTTGEGSRIPRGVWALGLVSLCMDASSETIHALLPVFLVSTLGASALAVGAIEGVAEATAAVTRAFSGVLSDRLPRRKPLVALGYGLAAFAKPIFPLATSIGWVGAARFIDRVGKGIRGAPRDALIADLSPPHLRGASFGLRQGLDTVGAFLGPMAAIGLMAWTGSFVTVFWIAVIPAFLSLGLVLVAVEEPSRGPDAGRRSAAIDRHAFKRLDGTYWWVAGVGTVFTLARFSEAFLVLRAQSAGLAPALVPGVLVVMNAAYALAAYPAGALSDRKGRVAALTAGLVLLVVADGLLAFASEWLILAAGAAFWGAHMGFTQGVLSALVADTVPEDLRGTAFGAFHLVTGVALLAASLIAGALWNLTGPAGTFLGGAGFALASLAALVPLGSRLRARGVGPRQEAR